MSRDMDIVRTIIETLELEKHRCSRRHELYLRSRERTIIKFSYGEFLFLLGELHRLGDVYMKGDMYCR